MIKILVVDDEPLARERLIALLAEQDQQFDITEASNGLLALESINSSKPDIVLLDIRMPAMDGLEVAHHVSMIENPPAIIFTTAYQDHALEAFNIHAVDYLLKPIRQERLRQALERAKILQRGTIAEVRQHNPSSKTRTHLSASYKGELAMIPVSDIRYLRAEQKYVIAGWPAGELLLDESLVSLEKELDDTFLRIHRNALVALNYIDALKKTDEGNFEIVMQGVNLNLPVSRRNLPALRKKLRRK